MIVCISGTPGTGKTAVAKLLAKKLGWKLVELHGLAKEAGCISGFDKERGCDIIDTKRLAKAVSGLKNVILDSHYSHEMPCDAVVVLKTSPGVLRGRLRKKGWPDRKVEENVQAEIMEVCKAEALELGRKTFEVDTTLKKPEEAAEEVLKILKRFLNI